MSLCGSIGFNATQNTGKIIHSCMWFLVCTFSIWEEVAQVTKHNKESATKNVIYCPNSPSPSTFPLQPLMKYAPKLWRKLKSLHDFLVPFTDLLPRHWNTNGSWLSLLRRGKIMKKVNSCKLEVDLDVYLRKSLFI